MDIYLQACSLKTGVLLISPTMLIDLKGIGLLIGQCLVGVNDCIFIISLVEINIKIQTPFARCSFLPTHRKSEIC